MAINYLNSIDLNKNELRNGVIHVLATAPSSPVQGQIYYNSTDNRLYFYDGTAWVDASGDITSVGTSTPSQITVSNASGPGVSLAIVTSAITSGGNALATGAQIYAYVTNELANIEITVNGTADEVDVNGGLTTSIGDGDTLTIGLPNNVTIANNLTVTNDLTVNGSTTLGDAITDTVDVSGNMVVTGNLTVNGTTTSVNSNTVNIGDNIIVLNSDETGTPSQDAGFEVERGTSSNRSLIWDESATDWKIQQDTGTYERIATYADSIEDVTVTAGTAVSVTETLSGTDNRVKDYEVSLDLSTISYKTSIGDGSTLAYVVTHNLGTLDVIVQLYDNSSYDTVYADVVRNSTNQVTVTFANAPSTNDIRVLIYKL